MKVINTRLDGCLLIEPKVHGDARGFFYESFHAGRFAEAGLDLAFVQTNVSRSAQGSIAWPALPVAETAGQAGERAGRRGV
jgi:dTDP-4-dehydrorhamnose 3,5-epimerase-like enzyme